MQFSVWVSFYEIYNEFLYDLLDISPSLQPRKRVTLRLSDDKQGNPYVKGKMNSSMKKPFCPRFHLDTCVCVFHIDFCCFSESIIFFLFCQTSLGSRCAVLRRLGGFLELDVVTRVLPALTLTKTPAVGRTDRLVLTIV